MKNLLPLVILVMFASCKKEDPEPDPTNNNPPVVTSGCNINTALEGIWRSDSARSWGTDSLGNIGDDTTVIMTYPTYYQDYHFYCVADNPWGYDPDTIVWPPGWKDHTYWYSKLVDGTSIDDIEGFTSFYYENDKVYLTATSAQDTAGLSFFIVDLLTDSKLIFTGFGPNSFGGNAYASTYCTKQ